MAGDCEKYIERALTIADDLLALADAGDAEREDVEGGVLYGTLRDCAYKIRAVAQHERGHWKYGGDAWV